MNDWSTNCQKYEVYLPNENYTHIWPMADHVSESLIILHLIIEIKVSTISNFKIAIITLLDDWDVGLEQLADSLHMLIGYLVGYLSG